MIYLLEYSFDYTRLVLNKYPHFDKYPLYVLANALKQANDHTSMYYDKVELVALSAEPIIGVKVC